jgi:hypothetical protein
LKSFEETVSKLELHKRLDIVFPNSMNKQLLLPTSMEPHPKKLLLNLAMPNKPALIFFDGTV